MEAGQLRIWLLVREEILNTDICNNFMDETTALRHYFKPLLTNQAKNVQKCYKNTLLYLSRL